MITRAWPEKHADFIWQEHYQCLERFYEQRRRWPRPAEVFEGFPIGDWIYRNRVQYRQRTLNMRRYQRLKELGYTFEEIRPVDKHWDFYFEQLKRFVKNYPHKWNDKIHYLPRHKRLRAWCKSMQVRYNKGTLSGERKAALNGLGFPFQRKVSRMERFNAQIKYLAQYKREHPGAIVPRNLNYPPGNNLGNWCSYIRLRKKALASHQIEALDEIGFEWSPTESFWERHYTEVKLFMDQNGKVPQNGKKSPETEVRLALWVKTQRVAFRGGRLTDKKEKMLKKLGVV